MLTYFWCGVAAATFVAANLSVRQSIQSEHPWRWIILTSVLAVAAFGVQRFATQQLGAIRTTGIIDSLLTVLTILLAWGLFHEQLTAWQWSGIVFITFGILLVR